MTYRVFWVDSHRYHLGIILNPDHWPLPPWGAKPDSLSPGWHWQFFRVLGFPSPQGPKPTKIYHRLGQHFIRNGCYAGDVLSWWDLVTRSWPTGAEVVFVMWEFNETESRVGWYVLGIFLWKKFMYVSCMTVVGCQCFSGFCRYKIDGAREHCLYCLFVIAVNLWHSFFYCSDLECS